MTVLAGDDYLVSLNVNDSAGVLGKHDDARVNGDLVLHTGTDDRRVGGHKRHRLLLHVGTHKSTGVIVVLKEGDHCRRCGNDHLRRNIHEVDAVACDLYELVAVARRDLGVDEVSLVVKRLVCLSYDIFILNVCRHVNDLVGDDMALLIDLAVRSLDEAVIAYARIGRKVRDKTDIRTFGRLDRAHTAVMGVVNVTDVEGGAVTGQTAGTQCRQTALVGQLGEGVRLIHELRKL